MLDRYASLLKHYPNFKYRKDGLTVRLHENDAGTLVLTVSQNDRTHSIFDTEVLKLKERLRFGGRFFSWSAQDIVGCCYGYKRIDPAILGMLYPILHKFPTMIKDATVAQVESTYLKRQESLKRLQAVATQIQALEEMHEPFRKHTDSAEDLG